MENEKQNPLQLLWIAFCVFGIACLLTGLLFNFYIERKSMPGFHYYYYTNPYMEYTFPAVLAGAFSLIISVIVLGLSLHMSKKDLRFLGTQN